MPFAPWISASQTSDLVWTGVGPLVEPASMTVV